MRYLLGGTHMPTWPQNSQTRAFYINSPSSTSLTYSEMASKWLLVALSTLVLSTHAFYLPGLAPTNFCTDETKKNNENANCKVSFGSSICQRPFTLFTDISIQFSPSDRCIRPRQQAGFYRDHRSLRLFQVMPTTGFCTCTNFTLFLSSFDFCEETEGKDRDPPENLGQVRKISDCKPSCTFVCCFQ